VGEVRVIRAHPGVSVHKKGWKNASAILWVDTERHSPRTGVPGWFTRGLSGEKIPIGWLPNKPEYLATYAQAASTLWQRYLNATPPGPLILLGCRSTRTQSLLDQLETHLITANSSPPFHFRWSAERITRGDLLHALGIGLGAALYLGHGFSTGWYGYAGLHHSHLTEWQGSPLGTLFCLTCHNASRHNTSLSFAETLVLSGRCGSILAATGQTAHAINQQFAIRLCQVIPEIIQNQQPLTLASCLLHPLLVRLPLHRYRILGDPTLPMTGSFGKAQTVYSPAPQDPLNPLSPDIWP
jgi:hypothetical protein